MKEKASCDMLKINSQAMTPTDAFMGMQVTSYAYI